MQRSSRVETWLKKNALVETLFLSNPAEEELILDPAFQQKMADKIVAGIKDFLVGVGEEK